MPITGRALLLALASIYSCTTQPIQTSLWNLIQEHPVATSIMTGGVLAGPYYIWHRKRTALKKIIKEKKQLPTPTQKTTPPKMGRALLKEIQSLKKLKALKQKPTLREINLALLQAAQYKESTLQAIEKVERALQEGADINAQDEQGYTALTHAGLTAPNFELIAFLLEQGADPTKGLTFYRFALTGFPQLIEPLITYVPKKYLDQCMRCEIDNAAQKFANEKIHALKALCSISLQGKTITQKVRELKKLESEEKKIRQREQVAAMLDPEKLAQHRPAIVAEFKRRLLNP